MSEVSEILQSIQDRIGIELFPKSAMANPDSPNVLLLKRCQALLQSHAVISVTTLDKTLFTLSGITSDLVCHGELKSELDRLTPTEVVNND